MKKAFGIIFLLVGLVMIGLGIAALTNATTRNNSFEGQFGNNFNREYRTHNNEQQLAGGGLLAVGFIFFVLGIVMVATKSAAQRKREAELAMMKKMQTQSFPPANNFPPNPVYQQNVPPGNYQQAKPNHNFTTPDVPPVPNSMEDKFNQIERLGKLKEQGLLTEEEFQQQKKRILE